MGFDLGSFLGSTLGGIFGFGSNLASGSLNYKSQKKLLRQQNQYDLDKMAVQNDYNLNMMNTANQWNIEQWNRENEYNSASAQVQRLRDAGLNPSLAMGNSGMSGQITSTPMANSISNGSVPHSDTNFDFSSVIDAALKAAQIKNIDADTDQKKTNTELAAEQSDLVKAQTAYQQTLNKWADLSESERIMATKANVQLMLVNSELSDSQRKQIEEQTSWIGKLNKSQIAKFQADTKNAMEQATTEIAKRYNLNAAAKNYLSQAVLNKALGNKADSEAALNNALSGQVDVTNEKIRAETSKLLNEAEETYQRTLNELMHSSDYARGVDTKSSIVGSAMLLWDRFSQGVKSDITGRDNDTQQASKRRYIPKNHVRFFNPMLK